MEPTLEFVAKGLTADQVIALGQFFKQLTTGQAPAPQAQAPAANVDPFRAPSPAVQHQAPVVQHQAPTPTPPVTGTVPPGAVRDNFGVPYNPELHSVTTGPTGGRNQDGSWKMKKNVSRDAYNAWSVQHRAAANAPAPQPQPQSQAPNPSPSPAELNAQFGAPPVTQSQPAADPFRSAQPGVAFGGAPAPAAPEVDFSTFIAKCNDLLRVGRLNAADTTRVKDTIGCQDETKINEDPAVRARAYQVLLQIEREILIPA